ncbi:YCF48-related protein [Echinicola jeungdonensis]|uniref:YCF48-related protein n=1 Tax=Echinicola jeungdonensis TaxID=709343 RepID=A0ABV5J3J3_9BACT|nr:YCF48-related protein [Echinicola jeungdonensis]MDN3668950.1 YCF48-related protein [Echinicola jeungdonensis]
MKRILLLFFLIAFIFQTAFSQSWRRIGSWGNDFEDIHWVNEETAFLAGEEIILKTIDGGLSWTEQKSPIKNHMLSLDFFDEDMGLIVGENGKIFKTENGGQDWELISLPTPSALINVQILSQETVVISAEEGLIFLSEDGGLSWTLSTSGTQADLNGLYFINADSGYVASSDAEILKTVDGGESWSALPQNFQSPLYDIYFTDDTTGYAVGDGGLIIKTINAGEDWTFIQSGTEIDYRRVVFSKLNSDLGIVGGVNGTMLRTTNGGLTFSEVNSRTNQDINSIRFKLLGSDIYAVANSGVLISSGNSGGGWSPRMSGRNNDFNAIQFSNESRGYLIGDNGLILLTGNGGASFTDRSRPLSLPFHALDFVSGAFGYVAGDNGTILNTTNSGGSWTALNPGTENHLYGVHFFDANQGYIVGEQGYMSKTSNRGVNWEQVDVNSGLGDFGDIDFFNADTGLVAGQAGKILRTVDQENWVTLDLGTSQDLMDLAILDDTTAIVVGKQGLAFKTTDAGSTWGAVDIPSGENLYAVEFLDESVGFIAGANGLMLQTKDKGETWEVNSTGTFQDFRSISFGDLNKGYAAGENGTFYEYSCLVPLEPSTIFGEDNICLSQQIYSVQDDLDPDVVYEWRVDGGTILEGQGTNRVVVRWDTPGRNAVLVRGQNECGNGPTTGLEVLVSTSPQAITEIIGEGVSCMNSLGAYEVEEVDGTEYIWEVTGGVIQEGQGLSSVLVDWTETGTQYIKVRPRNACGQGVVYQKTVQVSQAPQQPKPINGSAIVGLTEEEYQVPEVPGINYQWSTGGGGVIASGQGTANVMVQWENEGDFVLTVTPMNECNEGPGESMEVNVNLITDLNNEESGQKNIQVFPNPSDGDIHLQLEGLSPVLTLTIINTLGQKIREIEPKKGVFEFEIKDLPPGIHYIWIQTRTGKYVEKVWIR